MAGRISYLGGIVTQGLVLDLDAAKRDSYIGTGTAWNDISGNRNNGTLINGPAFDTGNGGSIVFDGINDFVNLPIINPGLNSFSIGCWVKTTTSVLGGFIGKHWAGSVIGRFGVYTTPTAPGKARALIQFTQNDVIVLDSTSNVNDGNWHYVMLTMNRSNNAVLYFDGNQQSSTSISSFLNNSLTLNEPLRIGTYPDGTGLPANFLNGNISIGQYYNRALTAQEILQNYNAIKNRYI